MPKKELTTTSTPKLNLTDTCDMAHKGSRHTPLERMISILKRNSIDDAARILGITKSAISHRLSNHRIDIATLRNLSEIRKSHDDIRFLKKSRTLEHITEAKLSESKAKDLAIIYGVLDDKDFRDSRGVNIQINFANILKDKEAVSMRIRELESKINRSPDNGDYVEADLVIPK